MGTALEEEEETLRYALDYLGVFWGKHSVLVTTFSVFVNMGHFNF